MQQLVSLKWSHRRRRSVAKNTLPQGQRIPQAEKREGSDDISHLKVSEEYSLIAKTERWNEEREYSAT